VWRFAAPRKDQLRLSLTQSYRSPNVDQITARPWLNSQFPVPGPNTIVSPDRAGNPTLKPERANGIDLAYEHFFKSGGVFSVNLFHRQIKDLIRNVSALETVSWATSPRYVNRPQNFSEAFSQGIEFDTKFSLNELIDGAPPINFKLNASVFRSEVEGIIGPDNRISEQPKAIGNVGVDYRLRGLPITLGATAAWTPGYTLQNTNTSAQTVNLKRVIDAYALWTVDAQTRLRLTVSNATPDDTITDTVTFTDIERVYNNTVAKNYRNVGLRLEMRF
jgi:iron complex outermembrane receptor protein